MWPILLYHAKHSCLPWLSVILHLLHDNSRVQRERKRTNQDFCQLRNSENNWHICCRHCHFTVNGEAKYSFFEMLVHMYLTSARCIKSCNSNINYTDTKMFMKLILKAIQSFFSFQCHNLCRSNIEGEDKYSDEFGRLEKKSAVTCTTYNVILFGRT